MSGASTTPSRSAAIYRKAAKLLEDERECFACCAISVAVHGKTYALQECAGARALFVSKFRPHTYDGNGPFFGYYTDDPVQANDARILALCFMAAMVEAGDA